MTVRHHIQSLQEAGLLDSYEERSGLAGRPKTYFKIAKGLPTIVFPARRYFDLARALVNSLLNNLGEEKTNEIIASVGVEMGKDTVKYLTVTNNVNEWTLKELAKIYIEKYLREIGAEPEIVEQTDKKLVYRMHNCLFYELSQEAPTIMCETLHCKFHQSLIEAMNKNLKDTQTNCMGRGGNYCEHTIELIPENENSLKAAAK